MVKEGGVEDMAERGEGATGTSNTIYDLASVLYHTLDAGASYDQYIRDAEEAGDQELVEFFRVLRDEDSRRADYAQELIAQRTPTGTRMEDTARAEDRRTEGAVSPTRDEEAPSTEQGVRARPLRRDQEQDKGLIGEVRDRLLGPREKRGNERTDRPERR
jgi:hypothetical protein